MNNLLSSAIVFFFSATASGAKLPTSWYELPEHRANAPFAVASVYAKQENEAELKKELRNQLGAIFSAQTSALEKHSAAFGEGALSEGKKTSELFVPADEKGAPWRLTGFVGNLGVAVNGKVGLLGWKGSSGLSVFWIPKKVQGLHQFSAAKVSEELSSDAALVLTAQTSPAALDAEINSIIKGAMASHKVKNEAELKKNFREAVLDFVDIASKVDNANTNGEWFTSRLRADLDLDASGNVGFSSVGVGLKVRIEWFRTAGKKQAPIRKSAGRWLDLRGMEDFLLAMCEDLDAAVEDGNTPGADFQPRFLKVGLGMGASGNVGLAKASASASMLIYFSRSKDRPKRRITAFSSARKERPLYMVESRPTPEQLRLGRSVGKLVSTSSDESGMIKDAIYQLDREIFRKYLKRAISIGRFFAESADESKTKRWKPKYIATSFDISVGGGIGVATVSGSVGTSITFENQSL